MGFYNSVVLESIFVVLSAFIAVPRASLGWHDVPGPDRSQGAAAIERCIDPCISLRHGLTITLVNF
jgi:hypothetical protein